MYWDGPVMSQIIPLASQQERMIMNKLASQQHDHARRKTIATLRGNFHRLLNRAEDKTNSRHERLGKNDPIHNPQDDHHATCDVYFDAETSAIVEAGPEKILFEEFGYQGCCSQEFDYDTWLFTPTRVDLDDLFTKYHTKRALGDGVKNRTLVFLVSVLVVLAFRFVPCLVRKRSKSKPGQSTARQRREEVAYNLSCRWEDRSLQSQMLQPPSSC